MAADRLSTLKKAWGKAMDRSFPNGTNHFQLALGKPDGMSAKELLAVAMGVEIKSQTGYAPLKILLSDLYGVLKSSVTNFYF
jgi:hypothetical protein